MFAPHSCFPFALCPRCAAHWESAGRSLRAVATYAGGAVVRGMQCGVLLVLALGVVALQLGLLTDLAFAPMRYGTPFVTPVLHFTVQVVSGGEGGGRRMRVGKVCGQG